jgi:NADH:ubiquinone oxidoreductase subunit E
MTKSPLQTRYVENIARYDKVDSIGRQYRMIDRNPLGMNHLKICRSRGCVLFTQ